jgi:hypothetical protein
MDWQQKAAALDAVADIRVCIRKPNDWYVDQRIDVGGDGMLRGIYGNGTTPIEAIEDHWQQLVVNLAPGRYLVIDAAGEKRRHVRWNGFMWVDLQVKDAA